MAASALQPRREPTLPIAERGVWVGELVRMQWRRSFTAAFSGNYSPTFRVNLFKGQELLTFEDGTDRLSRNVGKDFTTLRCVIA